MKKTILLLISFLFSVALNIYAISRTSSEAFNIASSFCQKAQSNLKRSSLSKPALNLAYICKDSTTTRSSAGNNYYYVFNIGENGGFIIVSGDDRAKEILGYSETGNFNIDSLPPNFFHWLGFYQQELKSLMAQPDTDSVALTIKISKDLEASKTTYATSVAPLLRGIKWGQDAPYNNLCPIMNTTTSEKAVAGCVAVSMAEVMKYYNWPVSGTGSNSYTPKNLSTPLSVDFSQATYDWANMAETYNSSSTEVQKNAIATLMYHAGVAANMDYGTSGSYAQTMDGAKALINNFSYDPNIFYYHRYYYSESEWINLIKAELNAKRPFIYSGASYGTAHGHMFLCDGYDSNDLFHFNWGWNGFSDGYFELSALTPSAISDDLNYSQSVLMGLQPNASSTISVFQLVSESIFTISFNSINRNDAVTISMTFSNLGINAFSGSIGLALYDKNGFIGLIKSNNITSLGWLNSYQYNPDCIIPSYVADGNYKLYSVFKATGQSDWQIMKGKTGKPNYLDVAVTSSNVTCTTPDVSPKLSLNSLTVAGNLYQNKTGRFNINITNTGEEYNSLLLIYLESLSKDTTRIISYDYCNIPSGETRLFYFTGDVLMPTGQYNLFLVYDPLNDLSTIASGRLLGDYKIVNVLAEPTEAPYFTLSSKISFPDPTKVDKSNPVLTAQIKNTGGYFKDYVVAFVYPVTGGEPIAFFGYETAIFDKNEERAITFTGGLDLEPGPYFTAILYRYSTWNFFTPNDNGQLAFTLVDGGTEIEQTAQRNLYLYPNPAIDKLCLKSDDIVKIIRIMDLSGKQVLLIKPEKSGKIVFSVNELKAGVYILQSETAMNVLFCKFIKK